jgi:hypothetical protein
MTPAQAQKIREALPRLSEQDRIEAQKLLDEWSKRRRQRKFFSMFPDSGKYSRAGYVKHMEFIRSGMEFRERCFLAANRSGKTVVGGYETVCHLTGRYPDWWDGYKFAGPVKFWAAGDTAKTVRDIIQVELLGDHNEHGTGMIPGEDIVKTTPKAGVPDAVGAYRTLWTPSTSSTMTSMATRMASVSWD